MEFTGSRYEGNIVNGRIEGEGKYFLPNGNVYIGMFKDGYFHGPGTIYFPKQGKFTATWDIGRAVGGEYSFKDGLVYERQEWNYCQETDRRFYTEHLNGLKPAGESQIVNVEPPKNIPNGTYDVGDGYFDPGLGLVYDYQGEFLRAPNIEEITWIPRHCRRQGGVPEHPKPGEDGGHQKTKGNQLNLVAMSPQYTAAATGEGDDDTKQEAAGREEPLPVGGARGPTPPTYGGPMPKVSNLNVMSS